MKKDKFELEFTQIVQNIQNTNYDSIIAEFKLILLLQETIIISSWTRIQIIELFQENRNKVVVETEAVSQALGEVYANLIDSHKCTSVFDDFGESYCQELYRNLKQFHSNSTFLNECTE